MSRKKRTLEQAPQPFGRAVLRALLLALIGCLPAFAKLAVFLFINWPGAIG